MTQPRRNSLRLSFIGFGEAGQALATGLHETGVESISAWDILFPENSGQSLRQAAGKVGARLATSAGDAVKGADIVISAVTAASSLDAARATEPHLTGNPYFLDINSVSPGRKQETARLLDAAARYVDVAVMAPIHPARHRTPVLLAGPHAASIEPILTELGMKASLAGAETGAAAAIKMVRSVMVKGMEALTYECFVAAARAGVEEAVVASLSKSFPGVDWNRTIAYNLERMANHGARRAAEMQEVAETLREWGVEPHMALATVERQHEMGEIGRGQTIQDAIARGRAELLHAVSAAARERN
jgi:3-hydroxyisobutyrate dehydrogenase-like beta-hydroxyacid dehydrogenase